MVDKTRVAIAVLVLIVVVMGGIMLFTFLIKPKVTGYTTQQQLEGAQVLYLDIVRVISQCQQYPLPFGNTTFHLIAIECLQPPAQPQ